MGWGEGGLPVYVESILVGLIELENSFVKSRNWNMCGRNTLAGLVRVLLVVDRSCLIGQSSTRFMLE